MICTHTEFNELRGGCNIEQGMWGIFNAFLPILVCPIKVSNIHAHAHAHTHIHTHSHTHSHTHTFYHDMHTHRVQ